MRSKICRNSSSQAVCDTPIARITGYVSSSIFIVAYTCFRLVLFFFSLSHSMILCRSVYQWCGDAVGQTAPIEERLMEFAHDLWGNSAFHMLMHSFWCDPRFELCKPELMVSVS